MAHIILGILCIGYGIYTTIIRLKAPEKLGKYEAMKSRFGENTGKLLHIVFYSGLPIIAGIVMIFNGVN